MVLLNVHLAAIWQQRMYKVCFRKLAERNNGVNRNVLTKQWAEKRTTVSSGMTAQQFPISGILHLLREQECVMVN
jgi:hypothetical protein